MFNFRSNFLLHWMSILTSSLLTKIISLQETLRKLVHLLDDPIDAVVLSLVMHHSVFVDEVSIGLILFELGA